MESTHILSLDRSVFVKDAEQVKQRFSLKEAFLNWIGLFLVLVAVVILYFVIRNMSYSWIYKDFNAGYLWCSDRLFSESVM